MLLKYLKIYYTISRVKYGDSMKRKYSISLLVVAILLAFSMTVGSSYAFWTKSVAQESTNEVIAGCLKIEINDLDVEGNSTSINLPNTYPMSNYTGLTLEPYTMTIKNVCSIKAEYKILLSTLTNSLLTESKMKYHFVKTSPVETTMAPALINKMNVVNLEESVLEGIGSLVNGNVTNTYELGTGVLNAQNENVTDSVTYELRLWIDESAGNEVMGEEYQAAISVYAEATE